MPTRYFTEQTKYNTIRARSTQVSSSHSAAYHDVLAVEVKVVNGRLERVQELHAPRHVQREPQRLVLVDHDA